MGDIEKQAGYNSARLDMIEKAIDEAEKENRRSHMRIENKVDALALDLTGIKYMARGIRWMAGIFFASAVWLLHEVKFIRDLFR